MPINYDSKRWKRLAAAIMRRDKYQCQYARRYGRMVPAEVVHHIFPAEDYPELAWEPWNLIALSRAAHNRMHDRDSNELTQTGEELLRRIAQKNGFDVPDRYQADRQEPKAWRTKKSRRWSN